MTEEKSHAAPLRFPWPPVVLVATIAAGVVLGILVPLPWFGSPLSDLLAAVGLILAVLAAFTEIAALVTLHRASTTVRPDRIADHLVKNGPFAFSRNPIYLGNAGLVFGIGLMAQNVWLLLLAFVAARLTRKIAIEPEERHLEHRFGKAYRDYRKKVRRWL